jgi:flavodoxin
MKALIVYWTHTSHTRRAAEDLAEGLRAAGVEVELADIQAGGLPDPAGYEILLVGSPCHAGSIKLAGTGICAAMEHWLRGLPRGSLSGKTAAAFSVHSKLGAGRTVGSMEGLLADAGAKVISPGPVAKAGVPFSLWEGPHASDADREALRAFGRSLAALKNE